MYNDAVRISYDEIVRDYLESLHSKLRNFSVEPEFLATWVHDEDDHVSLFELFAAAQSSGCRQLTVDVGADTAARLDRKRLEALIAPLGAATISGAEGGGLSVSVALCDRVAAPSPSAPAATAAPLRAPKAAPSVAAASPAARPGGEIHEAYRQAVRARAASPRFEGTPAVAPGGMLFESAEAEARLQVVVAADGIVASAAHRGASGDLRGLLDGLCEVVVGRSFQEACDHAVIRLEALLRDPRRPPPVRGVITPRSADPAFALPQSMLRAAYRHWAAKTGARPGWNFWDDQPAAAWIRLPGAEKLERSRSCVLECCRELGIGEEGVEVIDLLNDCRIVLAATPEAVKPSFAPRMMALEKLVKARLDARIELQLESLEDRNRRAERTARADRQL